MRGVALVATHTTMTPTVARHYRWAGMERLAHMKYRATLLSTTARRLVL